MPLAVASTNAFGLRLLARLGPGQLVFSPLGVHAALSTLRGGATGEARAALDAVLGDDAPVISVEEEAVELALAQGVWIDQEYRLADTFRAAADRRGVAWRSLNFSDPAAPEIVNAWAAEKTRGMIPRIVDAFQRDEKLALADAAYFEGGWTVPFDPDRTEERPFTRPDGSTVAVATMSAEDDFDYAEDGEHLAIRLRYGDLGELAFVAVMAREGVEAPPPESAVWDDLRFESRPGRVELPRVAAESRFELGDPLKALGLGPAFAPGADFDGLFEGPAPAKSLSRVLHRARVDVDEAGTRAAAVTVVTARAVSLPARPPEPFELRLDRPFLWAIEHRPTGTLLFLGRVTDPSTSEEST